MEGTGTRSEFLSEVGGMGEDPGPNFFGLQHAGLLIAVSYFHFVIIITFSLSQDSVCADRLVTRRVFFTAQHNPWAYLPVPSESLA